LEFVQQHAHDLVGQGGGCRRQCSQSTGEYRLRCRQFFADRLRWRTDPYQLVSHADVHHRNGIR